MIKQTIHYTDFDGVERVEDHYFNLTKAELVEMELSTEGGFAETLQAIAASNNGGLILAKFKEIIAKAYGVRSPDGRRFIKRPELFQEFSETEAYSELFVMLATDAKKSAAFINGLVPASLVKDAAKAADAQRRETQTVELREETQNVQLRPETGASTVNLPTTNPVVGEAPKPNVKPEQLSLFENQPNNSNYVQRPPHELGLNQDHPRF